MKCGVPTCRAPAKLYGVCGRHKGFYWHYDDPAFKEDLKAYEALFSAYLHEARKLESQGRSILEIQGCWGMNLAGVHQHAFPPHLQTVGQLYESLIPAIQYLQTKYDPTLVCNVTTRINHKSIMCSCSICSLR